MNCWIFLRNNQASNPSRRRSRISRSSNFQFITALAPTDSSINSKIAIGTAITMMRNVFER
jgi:hypothetical protein